MARLLPYIFCILVISNSAQISFSTSAVYYPGNEPYSSYCADFNGDGKQDFACGTWNFNSDIIYIYLGNGNGTFLAASYYTVSGGHNLMIGGDFNNDGKVDLASANGSNSVCVLIGNGNGTFSGPSYYLAGASGNSICSADFNNDGFPDIATASGVSNNINVLFGSLSGTFSPATSYSFGVAPSSLITGDYNSDGFYDLIYIRGVGNAYLLLGSVTGTFSPPIATSLGSYYDNSITSGDINNDGKLDIVVSFFTQNLVTALLGNGNGTFQFLPGYPVSAPIGTSLCDLDCDGNLDFITNVGTGGSRQVVTMKGNGNGTFSQPITHWTFGLNPIGLNIGEFNGDGKPDFIAGNYYDMIDIVLNASSTPNFSINSSSSNSVCIGQPITLTLLGAISSTWSGGITNGVAFTPTMSNTYTVAGTTACGIRNDSIRITMLPLPTVQVVQSKTLTCPQESLTCFFTPASISLSLNGIPSAPAHTIAPIATSFYTLTGRDFHGCTGTHTFVHNVSQPPIISIAGGSIICTGSSITETATGASSYTWSTGNKSNIITLSPGTTTIYTVTASDSIGCINTATLLLSVVSNSLITDFDYPEICQKNDSVMPRLSNGFSLGGIFTSNGVNIDPSTGEVDPRSAMPGSYSISYSITTVGCQRSGTRNLVIVPGMNLFENSTINLTPGATITLQPDISGDHFWGPAAYLSCTFCPSPIASPSGNTQYCILDTINSCVNNRCVNIIVSCESTDFSTPNAFSPNGDNKNDEFCLQGWNNCVTDFDIKIFDRWGEMVYKSNKPDFCWDGIYNGQLLSADAYIYLIKAIKYDKTIISKKGNIELIR